MPEDQNELQSKEEDMAQALPAANSELQASKSTAECRVVCRVQSIAFSISALEKHLISVLADMRYCSDFSERISHFSGLINGYSEAFCQISVRKGMGQIFR